MKLFIMQQNVQCQFITYYNRVLLLLLLLVNTHILVTRFPSGTKGLSLCSGVIYLLPFILWLIVTVYRLHFRAKTGVGH